LSIPIGFFLYSHLRFRGAGGAVKVCFVQAAKAINERIQ
jgi:hypothetical protein